MASGEDLLGVTQCRVDASLTAALPFLDNDTAVHPETRDGRLSSSSDANDLRPVCMPLKMFVPGLLTCIEEGCFDVRLWINIGLAAYVGRHRTPEKARY